MAVGAGISVVIELLQLIFKRGLCEVDDVIHNVLGNLNRVWDNNANDNPNLNANLNEEASDNG